MVSYSDSFIFYNILPPQPLLPPQGPPQTPPNPFPFSTQCRSSISCSHNSYSVASLSSSLLRNICLCCTVRDVRSNHWWDSPAMVDTLHSASLGFPVELPGLCSFLRDHRADLRKSQHIQRFVSCACNDVVNKFRSTSEFPRRLTVVPSRTLVSRALSEDSSHDELSYSC
jgi:hypothetical protein